MSDPMIHPETERLQLFAEARLDDSERAVVDSHLLGCDTCSAEVEEWKSLFTLLATMPYHAPSKGFVDRVMAHVVLPDPWYVRAAARASAQLQTFVPRTTRGWAFATAFFAMPIIFFTALSAWLLSRPYITPNGLVGFALDRTQTTLDSLFKGTLAAVVQSDIALFFARALNSLVDAGAGTAGALALATAMAIALSVWVLYQNLFRMTTRRENHSYVSYSF
jgi:hypothetical protein